MSIVRGIGLTLLVVVALLVCAAVDLGTLIGRVVTQWAFWICVAIVTTAWILRP